RTKRLYVNVTSVLLLDVAESRAHGTPYPPQTRVYPRSASSRRPEIGTADRARAAAPGGRVVASRDAIALPGSADVRAVHVQGSSTVFRRRQQACRRHVLGHQRRQLVADVDLTVPARIVLFDEQQRELALPLSKACASVAVANRP